MPYQTVLSCTGIHGTLRGSSEKRGLSSNYTAAGVESQASNEYLSKPTGDILAQGSDSSVRRTNKLSSIHARCDFSQCDSFQCCRHRDPDSAVRPTPRCSLEARRGQMMQCAKGYSHFSREHTMLPCCHNSTQFSTTQRRGWRATQRSRPRSFCRPCGV